jgi:hypothetical protein
VFVVAPRRWFNSVLGAWTAVVLLNQICRGPAAPTWMPVAPLVFEFQVGCWTALAYRRFSGKAGLTLAAGIAGVVIAAAGLSAWSVPSGPWRAVCLGPPAGFIVYALADLERAGRFRPPTFLSRARATED